MSNSQQQHQQHAQHTPQDYSIDSGNKSNSFTPQEGVKTPLKDQQDQVAMSHVISMPAPPPPVPKVIKKKVKDNGLSTPLHPFQIISFIVIGLDAYAFYFINMVAFSYQPAITIVLTIAYTINFGFVLLFGVQATVTYPTDPTVILYKKTKQLGQTFDSSNYQFFCEVCEAFVSNDSKHCGACNRCVNGFDHHCRWLNNCVGATNYRYFFRLICSVFFLTVLHNATAISVIAHLNNGDMPMISENEIFYHRDMITQYNIILAFTLFFNTAAILFLGHLISLHIYLQSKNMTTFEYIQWKRNKTNVKSRIFREVKKDVPPPSNDYNGIHGTEDGKKGINLGIEAAVNQTKDEPNIKATAAEIKENDDIVIHDGDKQAPIIQPTVPQERREDSRFDRWFPCLRNRQRRPTTQQISSSHGTINTLEHLNQHVSSMQDRSELGHQQQNTEVLGGSILGDVNEKQSAVQRLTQGAEDTENVKEMDQLLTNSTHAVNILQFGAGGDDQSHVSLPAIRQINRPMSSQRRDKAKFFLSNKAGALESIQEKKEEDLNAAPLNPGESLPKVDIEESYSFSLRNYHGHRTSQNLGVLGAQSQGRASQLGRHPDVVQSYHSISQSQDQMAAMTGPWKKSQIDQSNQNIESFKNLEIDDEGSSQKLTSNFMTHHGKKGRKQPRTADSQEPINKIHQQNNNFVDPASNEVDAGSQNSLAIVIPISKFSSHIDYISNEGPHQGVHPNFDDVDDVKLDNPSKKVRYFKQELGKQRFNRKAESMMEQIAESMVSDIENEDEVGDSIVNQSNLAGKRSVVKQLTIDPSNL